MFASFSSLMLHPLLPLPPCVSLSVCFVFPFSLSLCFSCSFLWLQDYSAVGQSRCALDYEAEISLQSSCPAQFIKGGGGGGVQGRLGGLVRETELQLCKQTSPPPTPIPPPLPRMVQSYVCVCACEREFVALSGFW